MDYRDWGFYIKKILLPKLRVGFFPLWVFFPFWRMLWTNSIGSFSKENIFTENSETRLSPLKTRHSYIKSNLEKKVSQIHFDVNILSGKTSQLKKSNLIFWENHFSAYGVQVPSDRS